MKKVLAILCAAALTFSMCAVSFAEEASFTGNIAPMATVEVDGVDEDHSAEKAIDGDYQTRWKSDSAMTQEDPSVITLKWDREYTISSVRVYWETNRPEEDGYKVMISTDGGDQWDSADVSMIRSDVSYEYNMNSGGENGGTYKDVIIFDVPVPVNAIKIECVTGEATISGRKDKASIYELEVYTTAVSALQEDRQDSSNSNEATEITISFSEIKTTSIRVYMYKGVASGKYAPKVLEIEVVASCDTLDEALTVAVPGSTLKLLGDVSGDKDWDAVVIPRDITLDLNGYTLTAVNVLAAGNIIDTAAEVGSIKIIKDGIMHVESGNPYLPIYDSENGYYRFFEYKMKTADPSMVSDKLVFQFRLEFTNEDAYSLLAKSDLKIAADLKMDDTSFRYWYSEDALGEYANDYNNNVFNLSISAADVQSVATVSAQLVVESKTGCVATSKEKIYTASAE